jgi:glyceraldehyde 3-phosphate dehydrogenase
MANATIISPALNLRFSGFRFQGFAPNFELEKRREMTAARIGLMGFGRIGRNVFRLLHDRDDMDIVAIADIAEPSALTYLLKYDSIYGRFPVEVEYRDGNLQYGAKRVSFTDSRTPADTDWGALDVDIVLETTSRYRTKDSLQGHLDSGAASVVLTSSPETPGEIPLLLRGINDEILDSSPDIVALGSNTSNAAAPILSILDEAFGLNRVYMTVVKAMSNAGRLADVPTDAYRTSRAAGENIIPAETNSAEIITQVLPGLKGKLMVSALNVPVPDGSTIDMVAETSRPVDAGEVNDRIKGEVASKYGEIIEFVADPIVSSDVRLNSHSGIYDSLATMVTGNNLLKTITWFNNGWGYSHRVVEVAASVAAKGGSQ